MFSKKTYIDRRETLKKLVGNGIIILPGNNDVPNNYPANTYRTRQDSTFRYYFEETRDGLVGVIDIDNDRVTLFGDDIPVEDIVWYGKVRTIQEMATMTGVPCTGTIEELYSFIEKAKTENRTIHFLPPYRHDTQIMLMNMLGIAPEKQREAASLKLIKAVVAQRSIKTEEEVKELEAINLVGYKMQMKAMELCQEGISELYIAGILEGIACSEGQGVSFATIMTQHGEILHGAPTPAKLVNGKLMLCDCGAESLSGYCSDHTRTTPVGGQFTQKQKEIYDIVKDCHDYVLSVAKPEILWKEVHLEVCRQMTTRLKELGLMKGNIDDAVDAGAHALFMPHGLGHMMGMDVHDMEGLGQQYVGFDDEVQPSTQFGLASLRCGRRLKEGFVMTDEPGIYFIPDLIDDWQSRKHCADFINYDKVNEYRDFGGIRIEDDILITADGCRFLGTERIPY